MPFRKIRGWWLDRQWPKALQQQQQAVASFPADVRDAHTHSSKHRTEILASGACGCFYCGAIFPPSEIADWVDEDSDGQGSTALCPKCGIDSVIGDESGFAVTQDFLARMRRYWF